ncbi:MAG: Uma2 family endonuclease [Pirellulaceae bacterium]
MSVGQFIGEQRVYLRNISWHTYAEIANLADRPGRRIAYDQGVMEIMSPSTTHEVIKKLIARMIESYALERDVELRSIGSTTLQREDLLKGVEADECYYVGGEENCLSSEEIDLSNSPPTLAVEVEITRSSRMKLEIFAAIGIREVWFVNADTIECMALVAGRYRATSSSSVLISFPFDDASRLISQRQRMTENEIVRAFQRAVT